LAPPYPLRAPESTERRAISRISPAEAGQRPLISSAALQATSAETGPRGERIPMTTHSRLRRALVALVNACVIVVTPAPGVAPQPASKRSQDVAADAEGKPLPGTTVPCAPIAEKRQEPGCYVAARRQLGALPQGTLSWHLDVLPSRAAAEAAKQQLGTVVEAFDRTWLFTIAPPDWRPMAGADHVATVGP
jgi:hypothetical protein